MNRLIIAFVVVVGIASNASAVPVYCPDTGHYYEEIFFDPCAPATWSEAASFSAARAYIGAQGHLVTVTSDLESAFLLDQFFTGSNRTFMWIGGYQYDDLAEPDGHWRWITEEPWDYTNWGGIEPNGHKRSEDYAMLNIGKTFAHILPGQWGDAAPAASGNDPVVGYIVEYEPVPAAEEGQLIILDDVDGDGIDDSIIDFGPEYGIWVYDSTGWWQLHGMSAESIAVADLDGDVQKEFVVDFGSEHGIWIYRNDSGWAPLHPTTPESITASDLDNNGKDDLVIDFGPEYGIWVSADDCSWSQLHTTSPESIMSTDLDNNGRDDLVIDFGDGVGIWAYYNGSAWNQLHSASAQSIVEGDVNGDGLRDLVIDFGDACGIWVYQNSWQQIHNVGAELMAVGDIDNSGQDDVVIDFGPEYGIWVYSDNSSWSQLHATSPESITVGHDGAEGADYLLIDFGVEYGIWEYDNGDWSQFHAESPSANNAGEAEQVLPEGVSLDPDTVARIELEGTIAQNAAANYGHTGQRSHPRMGNALFGEQERSI